MNRHDLQAGTIPIGDMLGRLQARFQERLQALREAAEDWGVKPHHPEGTFVSAMIGTQEGFVEAALGFAAGLEAAIADARAMTKESADQHRKAVDSTLEALTLARKAASVLETEKVRVTAEMVTRVAPELVKGVREALVIRERRWNREMELKRAIIAGCAMFGLVIGGYTWRTVQDWPLQSQVSYENTALQRCQDLSPYHDSNKQPLCQINDFLQK